MGRKRKNIEMVRVTLTIPKDVKDALQEAGVNMTQLFLNAANDKIRKKKE